MYAAEYLTKERVLHALITYLHFFFPFLSTKCTAGNGAMCSKHQAKQLKDYENAVIAKRLEELDEDEIQALVEDIERDDF